MKQVPLLIASVVIIISVLSGDWIIRSYLLKKSPPFHSSLSPTASAHIQPVAPPGPRVNEWQEYHLARERALNEDPALAAEYQQLRAQIEQRQEDLEAAMVKTDPKVATIVAKLALLRKRSLPPTVLTTGTKTAAPTK